MNAVLRGVWSVALICIQSWLEQNTYAEGTGCDGLQTSLLQVASSRHRGCRGQRDVVHMHVTGAQVTMQPGRHMSKLWKQDAV